MIGKRFFNANQALIQGVNRILFPIKLCNEVRNRKCDKDGDNYKMYFYHFYFSVSRRSRIQIYNSCL